MGRLRAPIAATARTGRWWPGRSASPRRTSGCAAPLTLRGSGGVAFDFYPTHVEGAHENTVVMTFRSADGRERTIEGASLGGGRIRICRIDDYPAEITADAPTLVILQQDRQGMVSHVTQILAERGINIAVMRLSRTARGEIACCVIEVDGELPAGLVERVAGVPGVLSARAVR